VLDISSCRERGELQVGAAGRVRNLPVTAGPPGIFPLWSQMSWAVRRAGRIHPRLAKGKSVKCFKSHHLDLVPQRHPAAASLGLQRRAQPESARAAKREPAAPAAHPASPGLCCFTAPDTIPCGSQQDPRQWLEEKTDPRGHCFAAC